MPATRATQSRARVRERQRLERTPYVNENREREHKPIHQGKTKSAMNRQLLSTAAASESRPREPYSPDALRRMRLNADLSVSDLASILGVRDRSVERWEADRAMPQPPARRQIERMIAAGR